jgi:hypothetical protein
MKQISKLFSTEVISICLILKPILRVESQKTHFDGLSFVIISSVESCFTNDHIIITEPAAREL